MSVRRFLAYFLAVTAGSTVAFASFLSAPSAAMPDAAACLELPPLPQMTQVYQKINRTLGEQRRRKSAAKRPQIALADYRLGH